VLTTVEKKMLFATALLRVLSPFNTRYEDFIATSGKNYALKNMFWWLLFLAVLVVIKKGNPIGTFLLYSFKAGNLVLRVIAVHFTRRATRNL